MDNFYQVELEKALSEQLYGIIAYRIDHEACTGYAAFAYVDILEQRKLRLKLSGRGYEVVETEHSDGSDVDSVFSVYETLDQLLLAASPMYRKRHADEIFVRLSQLNESS